MWTELIDSPQNMIYLCFHCFCLQFLQKIQIMTWLLGDVYLPWLEWNFDCGIKDLIHRELNVFLFSSSTQHKFNTNVARKVALVHLFIIQRNIFNSAQGSCSWPCRNWFFFDTFIDVSISVLSYKHSSNRFSSRAYFKSLATTLSPFLSSR